MTESERGSPRNQYERTYVLLPPDADASWARAIVDAIWNNKRYTFGSSADDAGLGDLDVRRVIAVNPHQWPGDLTAFYEEWYPGIELIVIEAFTPKELYNILVDDKPEPPPPKPPPSTFPLRGVHDRAGGDWLRANQLQGWCLLPVYVGTSWQDLNLDPLVDAGIRCLVNLRFSYAVDDHGAGTMPGFSELEAFARACLDTMARNPRAHAFIICNEMNNPREWPRERPITPTYYRDFYRRIYQDKPSGAQVWPGSIDPFNAGWGDWRVVWQEVLASIELDGIALHGYTHGPDPQLIWHEKRFTDAPLTGVYYDLRVVESQLSIIPIHHRTKEMVVTETNHYIRRDGSVGWEADAGLWVSQAYSYFATLGIDGACLFRHNYDKWNYGQYPMILEALTTSSRAT